MTYLDTPEVRLHVQEVGSGPRTVVLVHGLFANMALWYFSLARELAREHRVVLYDLRGHGLSSRPSRGYGLRSMGADLSAVVAERVDGPFSLVGFSFGAAVAARYACDHAERVERLVLIEPPLPMTLSSVEAWLGNLASGAELVDRMPAPQRAAVRGPRRTGRLVQGARDLVSGSSLRRDIEAEPDISDQELEALRTPVLVCYGADSPIAGSGTRIRLERLLAQGKHVTLPGGHFLPMDRPEQLASIVGEFLRIAPKLR